MKQTSKFGLSLPAGTDAYDVEVFNENYKKIDGAVLATPIKSTADSLDTFVKSEEAKTMTYGDSVIIGEQVYLLTGNDTSSINSYLTYHETITKDLDTHSKDDTLHITEEERNKWNTVDGELSATSTNPIQNKAVQAALTSQNTNLTDRVGEALHEGKAYTDQKVTNLVGGAPSTMDTLKKIADTVGTEVGKKASQADFNAHTANNTAHITVAERTKWNTVDSALSTTSVNPIQNKAVQTALTSQNTSLTSKIDTINNSLTGSISEINSNLSEVTQSLNNGNMDFTVGTDGYPYATYKVGADSVSKKLGKSALSGSLETSVSSTGQSVYPSGSAQINLSVVDYNTLKISNCSLNSTAGHTNSFSVSSNLGTITTSFGNGIYNIKSCNYVSIYMYHQKTNSDGGKIMACNWEIS